MRGYRASYVTAYNNKDYGIYAFDSVDGLFEHSYASGSPDSGFYIGQCHPCDAVIDQVVAENNALGYSGTNAGGNLQIVRSVWRRNWAGIVPNTLDSELLPPFRQVDIVGNLVEANHNRDAPGVPLEWSTFGNGILLAGGNDSRVERNRVVDHTHHGILVTPNLDEHLWTSSGNRVVGNVVEGSGRADLALAAPAGDGNCFQGNQARTSIPVGLQAFQRCEGLRLPLRMDLSTTLASLGQVAEANTGAYPVNRPEDQPAPPPQPQLPGGAGAPVRPAVDVFAAHRVDLAQVPLPGPSDQPATVRKEPTVFGVPDPRRLPLAARLRPLRLPAAVRAVRRLDLAGPVGPGPPRRPRPRGGHRLDRGHPAGAVRGRDRLPRPRAGPSCRPGCGRRWSAAAWSPTWSCSGSAPCSAGSPDQGVPGGASLAPGGSGTGT